MKKRTLIKIISASFMYPYQIFYHDTPDEFYAEFEQHSNYLQTLSQSNGERFEVSCLHSDDRTLQNFSVIIEPTPAIV